MSRQFFIAGAQRSATTWLYQMMEQHPDVTMARPMRPEPKYFLREPHRWDRTAYLREFFPRATTPWLGEKSTSYIEYPHVAHRIAECLPDAHVVFLLRDPVERAISNWRFSVAQGLETLPLKDALAKELQRAAKAPEGISVSPFAYTGRGHYVRQLAAWARHFPRERIHLLTTERTVGSDRAIRDLFAAMGLAPDVSLTGLDRAVNGSEMVDEVPAGVRSRLAALFSGPNRELSERFGVDTKGWQ